MADFQEHLQYSSKNLVIAFATGGDSHRVGYLFEWGHTLTRYKLPHILLRDSTGRWYQDGVRGLGNLRDTLGYLQIVARSYEKCIALGLSAGAYGALLYGRLLPTDEVIAISPITGKGATVMPEFDSKFHERIEHPEDEYYPVQDLRKLYAQAEIPRVFTFISDGHGTELDRRMSERIGIVPELIPGYSHPALARGMRDSGRLQALLEA
jgi:hypothetical protein